MTDKHRIARVLAITARAMLVFVVLVWGGFALLSGVDATQDLSFWQNLPNSAPWVGLAIVTFITFKWPISGGWLVLAAGLASVPFFHAWGSPLVFFGLSLPIMALGVALTLTAYLLRD